MVTIAYHGNRLKNAVLLLVLALVASDALAKITLKTSRRVLSDGEPFSLIVESDSRDELNRIRTIPGLDAFDVLSESSSSRMQIVNGKYSSVVSKTYILRAKKPGTYAIGPVRLKLGRKVVKSRKVKVTVNKVVSDPNKPKTFMLKAAVEPVGGEVFVNQQISYVLRFYFLDTFMRPRLSIPDFKGFWREGEEVQKDYVERVGEVTYKVKEIRFAMFPQQLGEKVIEPVSFSFDVPLASQTPKPYDPFMAAPTRRIALKSNSVALTVKPIPVKGLSDPYVGQLQVSGGNLPKTAKVGDSISYSVTVSGTGNVRDLSPPKLELKGARVYVDKPEQSFDQNAKGQVTGSRIYTIAIVPEQPGTLEIPAMSFKALDPKTGKIIEATTDPSVIAVAAAPAAAGQPPSSANTGVAPVPSSAGQQVAPKTPVAILATDIRSAPPEGANLQPLGRGFAPWFIPALAALGLWLSWLILEASFPDWRDRRVARRHRRRALKTAMAELDGELDGELNGELDGWQNEEPGGGRTGSDVLRRYLETKTQMSFGAATGAEIVQTLAGHLPPALLGRLREGFELSDRKRFSGAPWHAGAEQDELKNLLKTLDRAL